MWKQMSLLDLTRKIMKRGNGWAEKKNVPAIPEDEAGEGEKRQVLPEK